MENQTEILPNLMREDSFGIVMRGYDRRQVDDFVTRSRNQIRDLEERLARTLDEAQQLRRELTDAKEQLAAGKPAHEEVSERLATILRLAEEEADQKRAAAEETVAQIRKEAEEDAQRILGEARELAERTVASAREQAEGIITSARQKAEEDMAAARQEAEQTLTSSREEADHTLSSAKERAERLLTDAEQRAGAINDGAARRLDALTETHGEAVRRLGHIRDVLTDLLSKDATHGTLGATVEAILAQARSRAAESSDETAASATSGHPEEAAGRFEGAIEPEIETAPSSDPNATTQLDAAAEAEESGLGGPAAKRRGRARQGSPSDGSTFIH